MATLGQFFPPSEQGKYLARNLTPGRVLYLDCPFTTPPKPKYLILVCADSPILVLVINSQINDYVQSRPHLLSCQVKMRCADYGFLDHDSYVDCSEVIRDFSRSDIEQQILFDPTRIRGEINAMTRQHIIKSVQSARRLTGEEKRLVVDALGC